MRVILLMNSLFTGGAEFSSLSFYGWLLKQGHTVKVVVLKTTSPSYNVKRFGFDEVTVLEGNSLLARLRSLQVLVKTFQPQVVHSVLFDANLLGRMCRITQRSFIHIESLVNEMYSEHRYADPQVTRIKLGGYRLLDWATQGLGVDHYHANGESVARHYQEKLMISTKKMTVIPRGREANPWQGHNQNRERIRKELGTGDRLLLINVARHEYQKGQDVLLEALKSMGGEVQKIQVAIVGREGKLTTLLKQKIKQHQLDHVVALLGHRDDVASLLAAADVFVFPSRFEGLPGAVIEAEAAGLPIVASDIPNTREVAKENINALYFPVDDSQTLALQLIKLTHDAGLRNAMGKASKDYFDKHFSIHEIHQRMLTLLETLAKP
jgi:glycosyltransferase involved in cell wall biosynthesis